MAEISIKKPQNDIFLRYMHCVKHFFCNFASRNCQMVFIPYSVVLKQNQNLNIWDF